MQSQTTNSRAKILGPFLTLILSSTKRGEARSTALQPESVESGTSHYRPSATSDETSPPTRAPLSVIHLMLGPFLTLILTLRRRRRENMMALAVRAVGKQRVR